MSVDSILILPILMFELDGYFQRVDRPDDLSGLYDDEYWDEVAAAFDAKFRPVEFAFLNDRLIVNVEVESDVSRFERWARRALVQTWRESKFRVARTRPFEQRRILARDAVSLWNELLVRT